MAYRVDITIEIPTDSSGAAWDLANAAAEMMTTDITCTVIEVSEPEEVE